MVTLCSCDNANAKHMGKSTIFLFNKFPISFSQISHNAWSDTRISAEIGNLNLIRSSQWYWRLSLPKCVFLLRNENIILCLRFTTLGCRKYILFFSNCAYFDHSINSFPQLTPCKKPKYYSQNRKIWLYFSNFVLGSVHFKLMWIKFLSTLSAG